jgi:7-cyano-7-deazaguanine reductase
MSSRPSKRLETFANPRPARDYRIHMEIPEFTCLCPRTGQPDFAGSYRDRGAFHEAVTNHILDDLVQATRPRFMRLTAKFNVRGGIFTTVVAEYAKPGWKPGPKVELATLPAAPPSTRG